jgi:hypothetical protein
VVAVASAVAEECAVAAALFVPQEEAAIAEAASVAVVARLPCRDLPGFLRRLPGPAAAASPAERQISGRAIAICQHPRFDPAADSAVGPAARESPTGPAASDRARAFAHRPAFDRAAAHGPPAA